MGCAQSAVAACNLAPCRRPRRSATSCPWWSAPSRPTARAPIETAERLCLDVLELAPDRPGALSVLYDIRKAQGKGRAAEALIRRIVALDPNNLVATNELALILLGRGNLAEAEHHARNAVRIAPENPQAHNLMGMILTEANRPQVGEYHYRRVLELAGQRDPILLANLAWNLKNQGRMKEARALYEESANAAPEIRQTLLGFARLEEADRNFDAAAAVLDRMDKLFPNDQGVRLTRAVLLGRMRKYDRGDRADRLHRQRRTQAGPQRAPGERPPARPDRPLRRRLGRLRRGQEAGARAVGPGLSGHRGQPADRAAARLLHRRPPASDAARQCAFRRAAADLHPGLPALRHHAGGADAVGASEDRRRRRTAADPRDHRDHAAHAGQPARLSGGAGRTVDGRPARGPRQPARLLPAEGPPDGRAAGRRRRGSPTRCR